MKKQFKFILAALTLMFISFTTNAQFKKTDKFVEGDFSYSKKTGNVRNYGINSTIGYFLTDRFATGVIAGISENLQTDKTTKIGVFGRCYVKNTGKLNIYSQLEVLSTKNETGKNKPTTTDANVGIGANYFLSKKLALTTTLVENLIDYNKVGSTNTFSLGFNGINNPLNAAKFGVLYKF